MDTYVTGSDRRTNHTLMLIHSYLSWAVILPATTGQPSPLPPTPPPDFRHQPPILTSTCCMMWSFRPQQLSTTPSPNPYPHPSLPLPFPPCCQRCALKPFCDVAAVSPHEGCTGHGRELHCQRCKDEAWGNNGKVGGGGGGGFIANLVAGKN